MELNQHAPKPASFGRFTALNILLGTAAGIATYFGLISFANDETSNLAVVILWIGKLVLELPARLVFGFFVEYEVLHGPFMNGLISFLASLPLGALGGILASCQKKIIVTGLLSLLVFYYMTGVFGFLLLALAF
jgi:hypothetical protein